jgi:hypothetical protein
MRFAAWFHQCSLLMILVAFYLPATAQDQIDKSKDKKPPTPGPTPRSGDLSSRPRPPRRASQNDYFHLGDITLRLRAEIPAIGRTTRQPQHASPSPVIPKPEGTLAAADLAPRCAIWMVCCRFHSECGPRMALLGH